jgi:hypothetical protein
VLQHQHNTHCLTQSLPHTPTHKRTKVESERYEEDTNQHPTP